MLNVQFQPQLKSNSWVEKKIIHRNSPAFKKPVLFDTVSFGGRKLNDLKNPQLSFQDFQKLVDQKVKAITPSTPYKQKSETICELTEVLDLFLQNKWDKVKDSKKYSCLISNLKKLMGNRAQGNIVIAQINPKAGDIEANAKKIMSYIMAADAIGADIIAFPEMSLMGYPIQDVIIRHPYIVMENIKWLKEISKITGQTKVMVGFVEPRMPVEGKKAEGKEYHNALAIMSKGKIEGVVRKSLLPTAFELNDYRTFEPSKASGTQSPETLCKACTREDLEPGKLSDIHGHKYGISICADTWNDKEFFSNPTYEIDPMNELAQNNPDAFINCSTSPSRANKENLKHNLLSSIASRYKTPYVYINQVGAIDEVCCDGASRVYNDKGKLMAMAKSFEEQFMIVNPYETEGKLYPLTCEISKKQLTEAECKPGFSLNHNNDLERTYKNLKSAIEDSFKDRKLDKAIINLTEDVNSLVTATLLVDALGPDRVIAYSLDSSEQLKDFTEKSGIKCLNLSNHSNVLSTIGKEISSAIGSVLSLIKQDGDYKGKSTEIEAGIKGKLESFMASILTGALGKSLMIYSNDKTSIYFDQPDFYGDTAKSLAPLGDVPKTKVHSLAKWLNNNRQVKNIIPENIIQNSNAATLQEVPAGVLDEIIWNFENAGMNTAEMLNMTFEYEKQYGKVPQPTKQKWIETAEHFLKEVGTKQWQMPPVIVNEESSIARSSYHQPMSYDARWKPKNLSSINVSLLTPDA